jgi:hypothetical protein
MVTSCASQALERETDEVVGGAHRLATRGTNHACLPLPTHDPRLHDDGRPPGHHRRLQREYSACGAPYLEMTPSAGLTIVLPRRRPGSSHEPRRGRRSRARPQHHLPGYDSRYAPLHRFPSSDNADVHSSPSSFPPPSRSCTFSAKHPWLNKFVPALEKVCTPPPPSCQSCSTPGVNY